ncbi:unnamed protein product, partial [marine sediment metagenome]
MAKTQSIGAQNVELKEKLKASKESNETLTRALGDETARADHHENIAQNLLDRPPVAAPAAELVVDAVQQQS